VNESERERTIRELFPLVRTIARRVARLAHLTDLDDLIGDGSVGLIRAVDGFDPEKGSSLDLYARRTIAGAMLNGLRRRDPVSERVRRTMRHAEDRRYALAQQLGTLPTLSSLERDEPGLRRARIAVCAQATLSLDAPMSSRRDPLIDRSAEPGALVAESDRDRRLHAAVALLPERQRRILALHYGSERSLRSIGRTLRISPQRISQLHLLALAHLRHTVAP
jgi:RNA polymerase sigma factor for flagellar operon FliA